MAEGARPLTPNPSQAFFGRFRPPAGDDAGFTWSLAGGALLLRLGLLFQMPMLEVDGAYWCGLARNFAAGDWAHAFHTAWPPLYPALIALAAKLGGGAVPTPERLEWSARIVSCVAGALLIVPLGVIARRLLPEPWPRGVLLLAAVHPRLIEYSVAALSESVFTLALVVGIAGFALATRASAGERGGFLAPALGGASFGLAFLTRPEALPIGLGLGLVGWIATRGGPRRAAPVFLVTLLVVSLPWIAFVHGRTGSWSLGEKGPYNFWRAHREAHARHFPPPVVLPQRVNRSPEIAPAPKAGEVRPLELLRLEPAAVLGRSARQLGTLAGSSFPVAVAWPVAILAAIGLCFTRGGPWWLVLTPVAFTLVVVAPFSVDRRFLVPLTPLALLPAMAALHALPGKWRRYGGTAALALMGTGFLVYSVFIPLRADSAPEQRTAGEWIGTQQQPSGAGGSAGGTRVAVMARKPWAAFYGGQWIADLPDASPDSILADARRIGVRYLVVDARAVRGDRPQLAPWLDPGAGPAGFRMLRRWTGSHPIVIYGPE